MDGVSVRWVTPGKRKQDFESGNLVICKGDQKTSARCKLCTWHL